MDVSTSPLVLIQFLVFSHFPGLGGTYSKAFSVSLVEMGRERVRVTVGMLVQNTCLVHTGQVHRLLLHWKNRKI